MIIYHAPTAPAGQRWMPTQAEAKALKVPFEQAAVGEDGRVGMCDLLNQKEAEIALNRTEVEEAFNFPQDHEQPSSPPVSPTSYTHQSVNFDDHFNTMPLAQQLHYAALAMENARNQL